ncbi:hypothetical protein [Pseudomonas hunanensis]|uniref:hypothetical protein n=1 Tax=Pseudomonas hunanensis TaxID=1247546 RepID=UPI0030DC3EEB
MVSKSWIAQAYPLQQLTIQVQGTRHSSTDSLITHVETVISELKAGRSSGTQHDDDFGYTFNYVSDSAGPSFFDEADLPETEQEIQKVLSDPGTSNWLRDALSLALSLDCVDAVNDAEYLQRILTRRYNALAAAAGAPAGLPVLKDAPQLV